MTDSSPCKHLRRQLIATDKDAEYIECLDCGAIVETGELNQPNSSAGFQESLSDA